jgi:hypothetical protein
MQTEDPKLHHTCNIGLPLPVATHMILFGFNIAVTQKLQVRFNPVATPHRNAEVPHF